VNLPGFCIKRPAFTIVISLVMVIIGMIGFGSVPVRWIPNVHPPVVTIETAYPGANARLVEHDITKVIESALSGINGVETLTSSSKQGSSNITIGFKLGRDMNAAVEDVRSSLERVRGELPRDAMPPTVSKMDANDSSIIYILFYDAHRNARELSDYIDKYVVPSLETIDGVGSVAVYGKQVTAMQVQLDPNKMAGANVTVDEVAQLLQEQNASLPSGQIRGNDRFYSVVTDTTLKTAEQFNDLIIRDTENQAVRIKDVGEAKFDAENADFVFRINGKPGIALGINPQSNANPLDIERSVKKVFANIKRTLPVGMEASIVYNQADFIRASIHSVYESLIEAIIFVWLVILVFLCNFRATMVPVITIPVCLISAFAIIAFMGFSINIITLMALVLAIGLVVDDAIVMLENISRHMEAGMKPFDAALKGSREMVFPVIAMTLTLAAVYAPIAFTPGLLGVLFREFTFTLAGAVIISGVVALTLSPMMCARFLKTENKNRYSEWLEYQLSRLQQHYQYLLSYLLQKRKWVIAGLILVAAIGFGIFKLLPAELAPSEDMDEIDVHISAPRNASYHYTDTFVRELESIYSQMPDVASYLSINYSAPHSYHVLILKPRKQRKHSLTELVTELTAKANALTGVKANVFTPPPPLVGFAGGEDGESMGLMVMTASDYAKLHQATKQLMDVVKQEPGFVHAESGLKWDGEQFQVTIDRERAADLNVSIPAITNTISTLMVGRQVGKTEDAKIYVRINQAALSNPNLMQQLYVRSRDNKMIPLSGLLNVTETTTPEVFRHFDRLRSDAIYLSLAPHYKVGDAVKLLEKLAKKNLPDDMRYTFTGQAKNYLDSNDKTAFTFLLALIFIYLVLVAQFESFIDPLIIMLTVPFAIIGALACLKIFGGSLNIYSNIGLITLIGLIAKHGILITDFANRLRRQGKSIEAAVIEAAALRLRPILMTTAAMVLGALPLAFAYGPGAESRQQIGLVIVGGMLFGTFFSLFVIPITYTYLARFRKIQVEITPNQENDYATVL
jgi:multidrug efflux pump